MVELVAERGYRGVTVRGLSRAAAVSTRTFYKHFANAEECFASTYDSMTRCALRHASPARVSDGDWEGDLRAGLRSLLHRLAEHPKAAQLVLADSFEAGPAVLAETPDAGRQFERLLADIFGGAPGLAPVPPRIVQGMTAGVIHVVRAKLLAVRAAELPEIAAELGDWMVAVANARTVDRAPRAGVARGPAEQAVSPAALKGLSAALLGTVGSERGRILSATAKLAARSGYRTLTVPKIRRAAGVSRRAFDAHFEDVSNCFLEAIELLTSTAIERAKRRALGTASTERGIRQMTLAFCAEMARAPAFARLGFIDVIAPGRAGLECRERLISITAARLRELAAAKSPLTDLTSEAAAGAGWRILEAEIAAGETSAAPQVAALVSLLILATYRTAASPFR